MILTKKTKLVVDQDLFIEIKSAMRLFAQISNRLSVLSMESRIFSRLNLHRNFYQQLREEFPAAPSQYVIRAIANVASDMKREKKLHRYRETAALKLDERLFSVKGSELSVRLINRRVKIKMVITGFDLALQSRVGAAEIIYDRSNKIFYLSASYEQPEAEPVIPVNVLGIDKGIVNIAVTSDGRIYSGAAIEKARQRYVKLRKSLQACGTKSAKRKLVEISKREARFKRDVNHCISKQIIQSAQGTGSAISLEDLSGIGERTTVSKKQRARHKGWSFYQLDSFIAYKAQRNGIKVIFVDPAYSSQQCPHCGTTTRKNRKVRDEFLCTGCGFKEDADIVGAMNVRSRGADLLGIGLEVNHPNAATV